MNIRTTCLLLPLALWCGPILPFVDAHDVTAASNAAATSRIKNSLNYLASDELKGRAIGSPEIDEAADHIASQFRELGLDTNVFDGSPFQEFSILGGVETPDAAENQLEFVPASNDQKRDQQVSGMDLGVDFVPLAIGGAGEFDASVVFVGYGITAPDHDYDEYANIDTKDKVVIILRKEPQQSDKQSVFNGDKPSSHAFFAAKVKNAVDHGAKAVILINDHMEHARSSRRPIENWKRQAEKLATMLQEGPRSKSINEFQQHRNKVDRLISGLQKFGARVDRADKLLRPTGAGNSPVDPNVPVVFCSRGAVRQMVENASKKTLEEIESDIDSNLIPQSFEIPSWKARGKISIARKSIRVKNVVAVIDGEGELADESIIVGAHYDHVGMGGTGSLAPWTTDVHNGADDNASGVVAMLEVARQISQLNSAPRRRIVFIAFTAEETGLLGSKHYVDHPRYALNRTVAMLNLDMVGRVHDTPLEVNGVGTSTRLEEIVDDVAATLDMPIKKSSNGNGPSDHASFNSKQIPVLHLFSGLHSDYHRPGDDVEKIDVAGIIRASQLTARIALRIDQEDERLVYQRRKRGTATSGGAFLGIKVAGEKSKCRISGVVPGSPAANVGIVVGDVISAIDGESVTTMRKIVKQLAKRKPGDEISLTVLHEKAQQTFKVQLGESR